MKTPLLTFILFFALLPALITSSHAAPQPAIQFHFGDTVQAGPLQIQSTATPVQIANGQHAVHFSAQKHTSIKFEDPDFPLETGALVVRVRLDDGSATPQDHCIIHIGRSSDIMITDNHLEWFNVFHSGPLNWKPREWHTLAFAWRPWNNPDFPYNYEFAVYIDGKPIAHEHTGLRPFPDGGTITVGANPIPRAGLPQVNELEGDLDRFEVYDRWLEPDEIAELSGLKNQIHLPAFPATPTIDFQGEAKPYSVDAKTFANVTRAQIVVAAKASPQEKQAAQQLAGILQKMTGQTFPIKSTFSTDKSTFQFVIGNDLARQLDSSLPQQWKPDELWWKADAGKVLFAGDEPNGTAYAICDFLEKISVRFFAPGDDGTVIPHMDVIKVPITTISDNPWFYTIRYQQNTSPPVQGKDSAAAAKEIKQWMLNNRLEYGRYSDVHKMVMLSMADMVPESLFASHPEYFGMDDQGVRNVPSRNNLNPETANPAVVKMFQDTAVELLRKNPKAKYFGLEPIDGGGWSQSPESRALDAEPGSYTDRLVHLQNQINDAVQKAFPGQGKGVRFFAYQLYADPPIREKVPPQGQVELTRGSPDVLAEWSKACQDLQKWDYAGWWSFHWGPLPGVSLIQRNFRALTPFPVHGVFVENMASVFQIDYPTAYITGKLMWNPRYDVKVLLDDFFAKFYGPAAAPMRQCFDALEEMTLQQSTSGLSFYDYSKLGFRPMNTTPELWNQCEKWIAQAHQLAGNDAVIQRRIKTIEMTYLMSDVGRYAQLAERYSNEKNHPFWKDLAAHHGELQQKLQQAVALGKELHIENARGKDEPANLETAVAVWGSRLGLDSTPFAKILGVAQTAASNSDAPWKLVYQDNFDGTELNKDWQIVDGKFLIKNGTLFGNGELYLNKELASDQRIEFDAWVDAGNKPSDLDAVLNSDTIHKEGFRKGYLFGFGNYGNARTAFMKNLAIIEKLTSPLIVPGTHYHIVCEKDGNKIRWSVNGKDILQFTDFSPQNGPFAGFYVFTDGHIDNVKIYAR